MQGINILTIRFSAEMAPHEVPLLRGAIIGALEHKLLHFHNHDGDGYHYHYPLIQYKILHRKAALVCLGEGTEQVGEFFSSGHFDLMLGDRAVTLVVENVWPRRHTIQVWNQQFRYRLSRWLPLNSENYTRFCEMDSLADRVKMLEQILTGNILSMAKGLGLYFDKQVICHITQLEEPFNVIVKSVKMMAFNVQFSCNVSIPDHIGLGKHASLNCGVVHGVRQHEKETSQ